MKKYIIILAILTHIPLIYCQTHMDIQEMSISKLKKGSNQKKITNGLDTTTVSVIESGEFDTPFIEVQIKLVNESPSQIKLNPNNSHMYITYTFQGKSFKKDMYYNVDSNNNIKNRDELVLYPNDSILIYSSGNIAATYSMELKFYKQQDNTINILKILPTLKFHYEDKNGLVVTHQSVFNVNVRERPSGTSDFIIPPGYHVLSD